ncbi:fibronectin type III domain-containing protein [Mucilaginibacter psychrotolerans]|uniref:Fibronectin type-III domain-containing protein n=1 Tax=Mucilaginibacter psychrotolerans TaxID=1524096 RepID=A0A4Y8S9H2_9SPHI|nr:hypothetical protein [Mucilaginibacter psychrotolerans]TFF35669.1 hypothetical protein E2R66_18365 [Mucilaginibacter psychrotolerans]
MRVYKIILIVAVLNIGCGKKSVDITIPPPAKAELLLPASNSACTAGIAVSDAESTVTFNWAVAEHADSYELYIKNLLTGTLSKHLSTANQANVTLLKGTPYSWYVISTSAKVPETAQSDTWKFYNSGPGVLSYAPFPAVIKAPIYNQVISTATVELSWTGSSVENNITGYDIYLSSNSSSLALQKSDVKDLFLANIAVNPNTVYYWKVITKDAHGNKSDSGIYQFVTK